ncbi:MAG TPA: cytochrome c [Micropepsaceae bacterium]|jgi:cytochrome c|nr:cytochrome c [Micropepsaceae bacterium]
MNDRRVLSLLAFAAILAASAAFAIDQEPGDVERGHDFAKANCATCHAVEKTGLSPYAPAPPFRTLHLKYDVEGLAEALAEGIVVGHTGPRQMPEFVLEPDEIDDLLAYLKSLEK